MKINQQKVKENLKGVPDSQRSHIYNATIVIEFLVKTFMPTRFFLPPGFSPVPGTPLGQKSMRKVAEGKSMMMRELYELYLLFREEQDYTTRIESRYIFGIIIRNLRYYKNEWEFTVYRVGVAQIWHVGPLVIRKDVPLEQSKNFPPQMPATTKGSLAVEADPVSDPRDEMDEDDGQEIPEGTMIGIDLAVGTDETRFVVVEPDRFKEATFEVDVQIEQPKEDY